MNFINKYSYICNRCNSQYSSKEIEDNLLYLCPKCGKAEKQSPLEGVLLIEYDYKSETFDLDIIQYISNIKKKLEQNEIEMNIKLVDIESEYNRRKNLKK